MREKREDGRRDRRRLLRLTVALVASTECMACGKSLSAEECTLLLDRYVELIVRAEQPETNPEEVHRQQSEARRVAHANPSLEFDECPNRVSRTQFECAMAAPDADSLERCLVF